MYLSREQFYTRYQTLTETSKVSVTENEKLFNVCLIGELRRKMSSQNRPERRFCIKNQPERGFFRIEFLMVNIQMQISAVREHIATTVEMIKHGVPTTLANWNMVSELNVEMKELRSKLQLIQTEMEKEEEVIKIEKEYI